MRLSPFVRPRFAGAVAAALGVLLTTGACTPVRSHQGYIVDADLVNSIQPGVDNRQSVLGTLGKPSFTSQFAGTGQGGDWYYVARDSRNLAFNNPRAKAQITLQISFDPAGNVTAIRRGGVEQIAAVSPYGKITPTLGKKRGFFEDLFGNIGSVGAPGMGSGAGGGGRNQP